MNIYLLYEADAWLSTDSKELIGVFTNTRKMLSVVKSCMKYYFTEGILDIDVHETTISATKNMFDEFVNNGYQTQTYPINLFIEIVETNKIL